MFNLRLTVIAILHFKVVQNAKVCEEPNDHSFRDWVQLRELQRQHSYNIVHLIKWNGAGCSFVYIYIVFEI